MKNTYFVVDNKEKVIKIYVNNALVDDCTPITKDTMWMLHILQEFGNCNIFSEYKMLEDEYLEEC